MPHVKTVSVTYERKFNLGDYNSATVGCQLWAEVAPDEPLAEVMGHLWAMAKNNVAAQSLPLVRPAMDTAQAAAIALTQLGLPGQELAGSAQFQPLSDDDLVAEEGAFEEGVVS